MDFEKDNIKQGQGDRLGSAEASSGFVSMEVPKKRSGWKIFLAVMLGLSILANIFLLLMVAGLAAVFVTGQGRMFAEEVIVKGPSSSKIAVINLEGIIIGKAADDIRKQFRMASEDKNVKGVILRVNSPGGTIFGSDKISNQISRYRRQTGKPVVAFMEGVAASGGYYASVACSKIVAEPTVITGSIGVIMSHFVLQEFLENKLGIEPVVIKSGPKKDWPSYFQKVTEEQREYINEKLITPGYERFVQVVADGRPALSIEQVRRLADGSIYSAQEALDEEMIDEIGYFDAAVKAVLSLAGLKEAQVVEYHKPFSLGSFLSVQRSSGFNLHKSMLYELTRPEVMYLWNGQ